jgi:hypothetical protein
VYDYMLIAALAARVVYHAEAIAEPMLSFCYVD